MKEIEKYIDNVLFFRWVYEPDDDLNAYWDLYVSNHPEEKNMLLSLKRELQIFKIGNEKLSEERKKELSERIAKKIRKKRQVGKIRSIGSSLLKYAAVALLFAMIGGGIVFLRPERENQFDKLPYFDIPGIAGNPTLILSDGSRINLSSRLPEIKFIGNRLVLNNDSTIALPKSANILNQLIIPYGCRGQVTLNDQSVVWLNAGSRLFFPTKFEDSKRAVSLFGEAFFEVKQNELRPFFVETTDYNIQVLGTKFNVSAYPNENLSQTVLTEGSIQLKLKDGRWFSRELGLKPNEMFSYNVQLREMDIRKVQPDKYVLWKEGIVPFKNEDFGKVIEKIEKYYDIQIKLENPADNDIKLDGKLNLKNNKYEVLYYVTKVANRKFTEKNERYFVIK